jgi:hypothetical protein
MVGLTGFEPATPCSQSRCATPALQPDSHDATLNQKVRSTFITNEGHACQNELASSKLRGFPGNLTFILETATLFLWGNPAPEQEVQGCSPSIVARFPSSSVVAIFCPACGHESHSLTR